MLTQKQKNFLLQIARDAIKAPLYNESFSMPAIDDELFLEKRGAFVTLHKNKELRGCIGYIRAYKPLLQTIIEMAKAAAFEDPRFPSVRQDEINKIEIEISVLSELIPVMNHNLEEIIVGRDGIYLEMGYKSGLLLPQVALENDWNRETFLRETCRKAGLDSSSYLQPECKIFRFSAEIFAEKSKKY